MLSDLPSEIIAEIASHLPTARAVASLSQTCHRLHDVITVEDSRLYRSLVKSKFPGFEAPPFWKDVAQALTSRSRALDRHAVIGRFVIPSNDPIKVGAHTSRRSDNPTFGYRPALDSYEVWNGETWADRKEVLAWGAADEIILRIKQFGAHKDEKWIVFNDLELPSTYDDICGLHLLKSPYFHKDEDKEHMIFGRLRGEIAHLAISPDDGTHEYKQQFVTYGQPLAHIDLSAGPEPVLSAHFNNGSISFYHASSEKAEVEPFERWRPSGDVIARCDYSKLLSPSTVAISTGSLDGVLAVGKFTPSGLLVDRELCVENLDFEDMTGLGRKVKVHAIASLHAQVGGSSGKVFLAGWGDGGVRLHDNRSDNPYEYMYRDSTDANPIYSILPFGNDRFIVGAGGEALLKIFDLRMPTKYSYLEAKGSSAVSNPRLLKQAQRHILGEELQNNSEMASNMRKDFSLYLSHRARGFNRQDNVQPRGRSHMPYKGAIYSLSTPSPSSSTVYTGVEDSVFRLDFVSTDDLDGSSGGWYQNYFGLPENFFSKSLRQDRIRPLSGYERPEPEDTTTAHKLRTQKPFDHVERLDVWREMVTGWDRRWQGIEPRRPQGRTRTRSVSHGIP